MIPGLEIAVGYLIAWAGRKARRVGSRLDADADLILDTELDRLHALVVSKLGVDPALGRLEQAAVGGEDVSDRTRRRVLDALTEAAEDDAGFASQLAASLSKLQPLAPPTLALATGQHATATGRDVNITAQSGGVAAQTIGEVTLPSPPDPPRPGRPGG